MSWARRARRFTGRVVPMPITERVPRNHRESDAAFARRRRVTAGVAVAGAGLLGASLSTRPNSTQFYAMTAGVAATWLAGGVASGPLHRGWIRYQDDHLRRPVLTPLVTGVGTFGVFYCGALVCKHIPVLDRAITKILRYATQGNDGLIYATTLANGAAEEVFFRGALYAAVGEKHPVTVSTAVYMLATVATRNPALVLASGVMGVLFGLQRRASGGIQAPLLTHLTWSTLMLRYLPPLFADESATFSPEPANTEPANTAG